MRWSDPLLGAVWMLAWAAVSALATVVVGRYAWRRGMLDHPGPRRSHAVPTPRGGGLGIVLAGLGGCALLAPPVAAWMALGLILIGGMGAWDDHRGLSPLWKFCLQCLAGLCLALAIVQAGASAVQCAYAVLAVPVLVNAWNFIDGIDGLAVSQTLLCALALGVWLEGPMQALALALAAACLGFLPFNFPRARIFAGDVGSAAMGYLLACLLLMAWHETAQPRWPLLLLPMTVVLADTGLTLLWRIAHGQRWWQPHTAHLYQRWARRHGHVVVTAAYAVGTVAASALMLTFRYAATLAVWLAVLATMTMAAGLWWLGRGRWIDGVEA